MKIHKIGDPVCYSAREVIAMARETWDWHDEGSWPPVTHKEFVARTEGQSDMSRLSSERIASVRQSSLEAWNREINDILEHDLGLHDGTRHALEDLRDEIYSHLRG